MAKLVDKDVLYMVHDPVLLFYSLPWSFSTYSTGKHDMGSSFISLEISFSHKSEVCKELSLISKWQRVTFHKIDKE